MRTPGIPADVGRGTSPRGLLREAEDKGIKSSLFEVPHAARSAANKATASRITRSWAQSYKIAKSKSTSTKSSKIPYMKNPRLLGIKTPDGKQNENSKWCKMLNHCCEMCYLQALAHFTWLKDIIGSKVSWRPWIKISISASLCVPHTTWTERGGNGSFKARVSETFDPRISQCPAQLWSQSFRISLPCRSGYGIHYIRSSTQYSSRKVAIIRAALSLPLSAWAYLISDCRQQIRLCKQSSSA